VRLLLERDTTGADTAMVQAARGGREAIVRLLLEKGAELESKDKYNGQTALSYCWNSSYCGQTTTIGEADVLDCRGEPTALFLGSIEFSRLCIYIGPAVH
jgi:ankyrin repeat protein